MNKVAILMTGTYREIEFLLDVFPELTQGIEHDIYAVLRHTSGELSRLGSQETDFKLNDWGMDNLFQCELPSIDKAETKSRYLIPVGPTDEDRECAILGMFHGVFTAIRMMKSSLRHYDYVLKTRTDYLPPLSLPEMIDAYLESKKIIVDGCASWPRRYPDRLDIPWQGSLNDILCFAPMDLFLKIWDFENNLVKVWTGIPETTLFRNAMNSFMGDDLQSPRRNESFLRKYFTWDLNDTKQSFHVLRKRASLPKPNEATYFKGKEVVKYFTDENRVKGKVERAKLLKGFVPEITRVSTNFFTYNYVEGNILSEADVDTFSHFLEFMKTNLWKPRGASLGDACDKFYRDKTYNRLSQFLRKTGTSDRKRVINGDEVPSCDDMLEEIDWKWLCDGVPCLFHGDPQPENVIVTKDGFCLLDWREDFGGLPYGDVYYDLAKIYHALIVSGEIIREGGFSILESHEIAYTLSFKHNLMEFKEVFEKFILDNGYDLYKVRVLSALIYLNIAPLHQEPYNRFLYYFGRKMLYELWVEEP